MVREIASLLPRTLPTEQFHETLPGRKKRQTPYFLKAPQEIPVCVLGWGVLWHYNTEHTLGAPRLSRLLISISSRPSAQSSQFAIMQGLSPGFPLGSPAKPLLPTSFKTVQLLWKSVWQFLKKLSIYLPYDPLIAVLVTYPREMKSSVHKNICTQMFTAGVFVKAPN